MPNPAGPHAYSGGLITEASDRTGSGNRPVALDERLAGYGYGLGTICFPGDSDLRNGSEAVAAPNNKLRPGAPIGIMQIDDP